MADLVMKPGETSEQFRARIRAAFRPPTTQVMEQLRRLLPPASSVAVPAAKAA